MNPRLRRLEADWQAIQAALRDHPRIRITGTAGNPPQRYHFLYRVKSLCETPAGEIHERDGHAVEVSLLRNYPRQPPFCRMLTPVYHPNVAPHAICIGDHWSAGESLVDLVLRIGEMLAFQSYNVKSPLNGQAARWVEENLDRLPLDDAPFTRAAPASGTTAPDGTEDASGLAVICEGCARPVEADSIQACAAQHVLCPRCRGVCLGCGSLLCPVCGARHCAVCLQDRCANCTRDCARCGSPACAAHRKTCPECRKEACERCFYHCEFCDRELCTRHAGACALCLEKACAEHLATCHVCGRSGCPKCATACQICRKPACREHVSICAECRRIVCEAELPPGAGRCSVCRGAAPPAPRLKNPSIEFACPGCGARLQAEPEHAGMEIDCPKCGAASEIPDRP